MTDVWCTFGRQTRAYAEYRVFSSLARFSDVVRDADVSLTTASSTAGSRAVCVIAVTAADGSRMHVQARGRHVYDAINRAARRIGDAVHRHGGIALSS